MLLGIPAQASGNNQVRHPIHSRCTPRFITINGYKIFGYSMPMLSTTKAAFDENAKPSFLETVRHLSLSKWQATESIVPP